MRANKKQCYLASPFGFTDAGRHYYHQIYLPALAQVVEPIDPWSLVPDEESAMPLTASIALRIGRRNIEAIRAAPMLIACLDGQEPDSGTVAELGFAVGLGKLCFALRTDIRQSGDSPSSINLQVEALVIESGGTVARSLQELIRSVREAVG